MKHVTLRLGGVIALVLVLFTALALAQDPSVDADPGSAAPEQEEPPLDDATSDVEQPGEASLDEVAEGDEPVEIEGGSYAPVEVPRFLPEDTTWGSGPVVVIEISGMIDLGLAPYVERSIQEAADAALIVLHVNTFGGRIDAAVQIRDAVLGAEAPTLAYVDRRAISAGALISMAADWIVFAPGGSLGAATPIQITSGEARPVAEKHVSYMRAEMRSTAEARGRRGDIAEAMVDARLAIDDLIDGERLLTLTSDQAYTFGFSDGEEATLGDVLSSAGLGEREVYEAHQNWAELVARILTNPTLAGILMSLGVLGLVIELYSPGFGFPGAIGITFLAAFVLGHSVVHLVGWEEVALLTVGFILLAVELFILPGFGIAGGVGIIAIVVALVLALVGLPVGAAWRTGEIQSAATRVLIALSSSVLLMALLIKYLPERALPSWLMLRATIDGNSLSEREMRDPRQALVGREGVAITPLRPVGKGEFGSELLDISSTHGVIRRGDRVRISHVDGPSLFVELVVPPQAPHSPNLDVPKGTDPA